MGKIISLVNQKGGVGKTTSSINLAAALGLLKRKVLIVDLDPQGNTTTGLGVAKTDNLLSIYELMTDQAAFEEVVVKTEFKNLSLLPATINLAGIDIELVERSRDDASFNKNGQLKKYLDIAKEQFDYIIIDCPPSLGILTANALTASDSVIIPVQCEFFALEGIAQLVSSILKAQKTLNPNLDIEGVLLTMLDVRTCLGLEVIQDIKGYFKDRVYDTIIPRLVKISEAPSHGKPIIYYAPDHKGSEAYLSLAKEVIRRNGK